MDEEDEIKKRKYKELLEAGINSALYEPTQRFGDAIKQNYVAYSGIDKEKGKKLVKGLKQIYEIKINPNYKYQNIHQQAGFSAEVKEVARSNSENIIKRKKITKIRTDDLGNVNDPLYDLVDIDKHGRVIKGSGEQMKFIGASENDPTGEGDATRILSRLKSKKFENKYLNKNAKIKIPSDKYESVVNNINSDINKSSKQLKSIEDIDKRKEIESRIEKQKKIKKLITKSKVSSKEAIFAREHPKISTAIDVTKYSHSAGVECSKVSASIQGIVSIVENVSHVYNGDINTQDAVVNVMKDTSNAAISGYASGIIGSPIKGALQNSSSKYLKAISKTNIAATIVDATYLSTVTLKRYFEGEIDSLECLETLGEKGTGYIASSMFALIGQTVIPIPVVGSVIGGMVGYALSTSAYSVLTSALKEEKLSREERERIKKICSEQIKIIRKYREYMEEIINQYFNSYMDVFRESFDGIKKSLEIDDIDLFIENTNLIIKKFGKESNYSSVKEFNDKMLNKTTFKL